MNAFSAAFLVAAMVVTTSAGAAPLAVRNGQSIHIGLAGHRESAQALRSASTGWRLDLAGVRGVLRLVDVTAGAAPTTMELPVEGAAVVLDVDCFRPDHAYRIELRQGMKLVGTAFIYLKPLPRTRGPIRFDDHETGASADVEIATLAKGSL